MSAPSSCLSCTQNAEDTNRPRENWIASDDHWRVGHAVGTAVAGWLVLVPRRHVVTIADLTDEEAAALGTWQIRLSRALHTVTGCAKTYVAQFAEVAGFEHVHFHVVPRAHGLPHQFQGPRIFGLLGNPDQPCVTPAEVARISAALHAYLHHPLSPAPMAGPSHDQVVRAAPK
ncbi:HIT family protein [Polymorphospora rubra]|uniref:HIT family protein n=1 Tax=Polymorphospora rubra TaxID=338584 RepID=UPI0033D075FC